jgi:predicted O-linked N-acetylglucosamine transferase (SPINDLY family)
MMLVDDATAAQQIRDDGIHILIDLGGHTRFNRLATFARKPAPVQVSWLGYFATTGVPGMDYLLTDAISVPPQDLAHFTEDIVYLPETRLCFTQPAEDVNVAPLPASINGHITFGCFQNLRKINDKVLDLWARVLHAVPSSVLLIKNKQLEDPITRQNFVKQMAAAGIVRDRVIMEGQSSYRDYLEAYADVDLMLDTFPFPGGTTTCEALWMGVPTLTLTGDRMISLQGASMLSCVGLTDWIAADSDDYVAKATAKAADTAALAQLRAGLRARMAGSALVDAVRFSRHFESALEHMWLERRERLLARGG